MRSQLVLADKIAVGVAEFVGVGKEVVGVTHDIVSRGHGDCSNQLDADMICGRCLGL